MDDEDLDEDVEEIRNDIRSKAQAEEAEAGSTQGGMIRVQVGPRRTSAGL